MSHKYTTPPSSPRSRFSWTSPKSSGGGSLHSSLDRPRTYYSSSPQALSSFLATRMGSPASSQSSNSFRTPQLVHSEQDSVSEGSSGEGAEDGSRLGGRAKLFSSISHDQREGKGHVYDQDVENAGVKSGNGKIPQAAASPLALSTAPVLSRKVSRPLIPCSSCGITASISSDSHIALVPCQHALCPFCIAQLVNGVSNEPPRPGMCFCCGEMAESFLGVEFVDEHALELETQKMEEWRKKSMMSPGKRMNWSEGYLTPPTSPGGARNDNVKSSLCISKVHGVARIDNIPWDITTSEIETWIPSSILQLPEELVPISILCNRADGRTLSQAYIELPTVGEAQTLVRLGQGKKLRERAVGVCLATQKELMEHIFPEWLPGFDGVAACAPWSEGNVLSLRDVDGLVQLCSMESPHILKAPERVFLQLATVLVHLPVHQESTYDAKLIASLVHAFEVAIITLINISENVMSEDEARKLLKLLVSVATRCSALRPSQKNHLLALIGGEDLSLVSSSADSPSTVSSPRSSLSTPPSSPPSLRSPTLDRIRHSPSSPSPLRHYSSLGAQSPSPTKQSFGPTADRAGTMLVRDGEEVNKEDEMHRLAEAMGVCFDLVKNVAEGLKSAS